MTSDPAELFSGLVQPSIRGIADHVAQQIRSGVLATGAPLPQVRDLAAHLHVSPSTVSGAWSLLRKQELIEGRGRQGSRVVQVIRPPGPRRYEDITRFWAKGTLDITRAVPDPALLPDLPAAIAGSAVDPDLNRYDRPDITPRLRAAVEPTWPFEAEQWLAVNGGYEGIRLILASILVPGDHVAVADPATPRTLDILDHVGARPIAVATDDEGPTVEGLARALSSHPRVFLYEPRASSRRGSTLTSQRRDRLVTLLRDSDTLIVEDDGIGDVAEAGYSGIGAVLPDRTVLVRSYSKSHGPDLRLAVAAGRADVIDRAKGALQYGAGWTSRLLQGALAHMLTDAATIELVGEARRTYTRRRESMAALLAARGIDVGVHDGLSLSVPTADDHAALLVLASHGIAADSTRTSSIRSNAHWVRLATSLDLGTDSERVADAFALAARSGSARR